MTILYRHVFTPALIAVLLAGCHSSSSGGADVRILNTSLDYTSLDYYLDNGTTDTKEITAAGYGTLTAYKAVGTNSYTTKFTRSGVSGSLYSASEKLTRNTHKTYVAYGNSGKFGILEISEDQDAPDSSYTKVNVLNAAPDAGSLDVYLTDPSVALADTSPTFSSVAGPSAASYSTIASGTYRIRVTAAGSQSDLRLDSVTGMTFSSKEILSIVVTGTTGGVLVNATVIPQQSTQDAISNPYARVRGAVGIPSGSNVSASLGGTTLLTSAAANTVSQYVLVQAGTETLDLTLNGGALTPSSQTLAAGADYTVLVLDGNAVAGTTATLLADDNRLPSSSGYAKVTLVNAMSSLGDPITLNVNYTPVASSIALGNASSASDVSSGTNTEIDTVDATTSTSLYTNTSATLVSNGVYDLYMFGSATSPIGALRTNR